MCIGGRSTLHDNRVGDVGLRGDGRSMSCMLDGNGLGGAPRHSSMLQCNGGLQALQAQGGGCHALGGRHAVAPLKEAAPSSASLFNLLSCSPRGGTPLKDVRYLFFFL
jgi:hypothetical protein